MAEKLALVSVVPGKRVLEAVVLARSFQGNRETNIAVAILEKVT